MATMPDLVLRDIHQSTAPAWWPPAPGWWWLAAALLAFVLGMLGWQAARAWRRRRWRRMFDAEVGAGEDATARIAAMSALLRRAGRRIRADADRLHGDAWLAFLDDGIPGTPFTTGTGAALRDAAFRRDVETVDLDALHRLARMRFVALMAGRR